MIVERGWIKWLVLKLWIIKLNWVGYFELFVNIYVIIIKKVLFDNVWNMRGVGWGRKGKGKWFMLGVIFSNGWVCRGDKEFGKEERVKYGVRGIL